MGIVRVGSLSTITGYKLQSIATGGGAQGGAAYLADTALTGLVEENVTHSGVTDGNCLQVFDGANRNTLEHSAQGFTNATLGDFILENSDDPSFGLNSGRDNTGTNLRTRFNQFDPGDNYRVHGFAKAAPVDWTKSYQWNVLYISGGTGAGQVKLIKSITDVGGEVRFWVDPGWETTPDNTSTYDIFYSALDVAYANAAAATIHFDTYGLIPIWVEWHDEIGFGNGSTLTGIAWADLLVTFTCDGLSGGTWDNQMIFYNKVFFFLGCFNPSAESVANPGFCKGIKTKGYSGGSFSQASGANPDKRLFGSQDYGDLGMGGSWNKNYFSKIAGEVRSFFNGPLYAVPQSADSEGDFVRWMGGNWGEPLSTFGGATANALVWNLKGSPTTPNPPVGTRGLGWLGGNSGGSNGDFYTELGNINLGVVGVYQDANNRDIDFWLFGAGGGTHRFQIFWKKSVDVTVKDAISGNPIQGVPVTIKDRLGNVISNEDSGAKITADISKTATSIPVDLRENLSTGQTIILDNEYITLGTVSGTGPGTITGCTREARLPLYFLALPHKYNTTSFNPNIYIVKSPTTDVNGQIPRQKLVSGTVIRSGVADDLPNEVTEAGVNYTCILNHEADGTNQPPNVTYWSVAGTQGLPWESGKRYSNGIPDGYQSLSDMFPWTVEIPQPGYETKTEIISPSFDSEGESLTAALARPKHTQSRLVKPAGFKDLVLTR